MTISAQAYYGGSGTHRFTFDGEEFTIPDWTETRFWVFTSADFPGTVTVRLPDVTTLRVLGWPRLTIANSTISGVVGIEHADGTPFIALSSNSVVRLGLISFEQSTPASWATNTLFVWGTRTDTTSDTFNVGSDFGSANHAETYNHGADTWTVHDPVPLDSGTPFSSASSEVFESGFTKGYFTENDLTYKFHNNSYPQVATSGVITTHSGMSNEGDTIYRISNDSLGASRYDPGGDAWSVLDAPTGVAFANSVSSDWGLRTSAPTTGARVHIVACTPDSAVQLTEWDVTSETYLARSLPVQSFGSFAPTLVGMSFLTHMHSGTFNSVFDPKFSSNYHGKYSTALDVWVNEPVVPMFGRGMGAAGVSSTSDRYTFGMGATNGYPGAATEHYRYKTFLQIYDGRSFFAWGARDRRENAWARVQF